jgi:hypothetical protein
MNRKIVNNVLEWTVPSPFLRLLRRARYRCDPKLNALLRPNKALKNRHAGHHRCFVIGNGPSLKTQNIRLLKDEICIAANSFFLHPDHATVAPAYWCIGDPDYSSGEANALSWLKNLEEKSGKAVMFFHPNAAATLKGHRLFQDRAVHFISAGLDCDNVGQVDLDLSKQINVGRCTVSCLSLPLAIYLGFREIYLIGCDANWHVSDPHQSLHFYETNPHFKHWDTNAGTRAKMGVSAEQDLFAMSLAFKSHRLLRDKALAANVKIINATAGGQLDVYPRINYDELFQ